MRIGALIRRIGGSPVHWLAEGLLIVISVALGFWVAEFQRDREDRRLATRVLKGVQAEVEHNLKVLEPFVPMHSKWVDALEKADTSSGTQSGLDVYFATLPRIRAVLRLHSPSCGAARGTRLKPGERCDSSSTTWPPRCRMFIARRTSSP